VSGGQDDDVTTSRRPPRTVEEHRERVIELLGTLPVARLALADCLGLALAEDLVTPISLPPFDNSAMDGYAVRAADIAGAPVELPVAADIPAGRTDLPVLEPGTAHRIMTGAPIPPGADAVVPVEATDGGTELVRILTAAPPGQHLRRTGEDVLAGAAVLRAGTTLKAAQLGLAAAVGAPDLPVRRRPRVLVLSTGSELVEPGKPLLPGQIYESNGVMLTAALRAAGAEAEQLAFVPDDVAAFHRALEPRLGGVDLLLTSGGVSAGAYEVVKDALTAYGVWFGKVAMQPGGPQGAGRYGGVPVVALPGNPVGAQVAFEMFVRPALRAAMGHTAVLRPTALATLTEPVISPAGRRQYLRGHHDPARGLVSQVGGPGSHLLAALAAADCLVEVPEEVTALPAGTTVTVIPLPD
jgi:molybdopterin molybdotransferase